MKISHNSITYASPCGIINKVTKLWHKCQSKDLDGQYELGIRYFDIRIKFVDGWIRMVHNTVRYNITWEYVYGWFQNHKDCYARVILDQRNKPDDADGQARLFRSYITVWKQEINIFEAIIYWNWEHVIASTIDYTEYHNSVSAKWYEKLFGIQNFAEKHNKKMDFKNNNIMVDYVQYSN